MRWPRGKYNGARIVGFEVKVRCDVTDWRLSLVRACLTAARTQGESKDG